MKEVRDFCGKLILESAKVVCSCTILCLNSKTVTALGEIYGTGFLDRGSTPLISTNCTNLKLIIKYDPGDKPKVVFFYAVTVVKTTVNI